MVNNTTNITLYSNKSVLINPIFIINTIYSYLNTYRGFNLWVKRN